MDAFLEFLKILMEPHNISGVVLENI